MKHNFICRLLLAMLLLMICIIQSSAQMPPPGYDRAKKIQEERAKMPLMDRDSIVTVDTVLLFDPNTYEQEVKIIQSRISVRDYCIRYLNMANPEILLDGKPHTIVDPNTYEDLIIRWNPGGKIDTIPK